MPHKPNAITLSQKITVNTFYCRWDFETEEEWEAFLEKVQNMPQEDLMEILDDGIEKEDLWSAFHGSKQKVRLKLIYNKDYEV